MKRYALLLLTIAMLWVPPTVPVPPAGAETPTAQAVFFVR
jgi:hypothetical protein